MAKKAAPKADVPAAEGDSAKPSSDAMDVAETPASSESEGKVSLLGIGGRQIGSTAAKSTGKRRTPGEIRIQKGKALSLCPCCVLCVLLWVCVCGSVGL